MGTRIALPLSGVATAFLVRDAARVATSAARLATLFESMPFLRAILRQGQNLGTLLGH